MIQEEIGLATRRRVFYWLAYGDNLRVVYKDSAELHKVHKYEQKRNMDKKLVVVACLDKDEVACCDDGVVA